MYCWTDVMVKCAQYLTAGGAAYMNLLRHISLIHFVMYLSTSGLLVQVFSSHKAIKGCSVLGCESKMNCKNL